MQRVSHHQKRPWCWERLRAAGEGGDRGRNGWMASPRSWSRGITSGDSEGQGGLVCSVHGVAKSWAHLVTAGDFNPLHLVSGWKGRLNTSEMNRSLEPWLVLNRLNYLTEPNWHILNRPYVSNSIRWQRLQEPRKMPPRQTTMLNLHVLDLGVYQ